MMMSLLFLNLIFLILHYHLSSSPSSECALDHNAEPDQLDGIHEDVEEDVEPGEGAAPGRVGCLKNERKMIRH